jgi:hypothetical protein
MSDDDFFPSIARLGPDEALSQCTEMLEKADAKVASLRDERAATPRGDKQTANDLLTEINRTECFRKRLRQVIHHYRGIADRKETQYLWASAIREVCGPGMLQQCYDWMRAEKKRRAEQGAQQP